MLDEKKFVSKADAEIKKYGILKDAFQQIAKVEGNLYEKRKKAFDQIKGIKELDNVYISDIYLNFTTEMSGLEEFRKTLISKINDKILPATVFYPTKAKAYKQNVGDYGNIKKQKAKQENEKIKLYRNEYSESYDVVLSDFIKEIFLHVFALTILWKILDKKQIMVEN